MSNYILTFSKTKFYPLAPDIDDIKIEDIAHALSLMTRANGHFSTFYSVAQHSINCYMEAKERGYSKRIQLGCLLHDASEAYLSDITRPVKQNIPKYFDYEEKIQQLIFKKYGLGNLSKEEIAKIKQIDDALLYFEFQALMGEKISSKKPYIAKEHDFSLRDFKTVEKEFIYIHKLLTHDKKDFSFVGVDGCRNGWVAVNITKGDFEIGIFNKIGDIFIKYKASDSIVVDMPIGLPESKKDIRPEKEARKILSSRSCCIFNVPCRQAVYQREYPKANKINRKFLGKGLSKQSFNISKKIREIDEFLNKSSEYKNKILEGHPEICFAVFNSDKNLPRPIYENKKTEEGMKKRLKILNKYYNKTKDVKNAIQSDPKLNSIGDDVIDALCLAVAGVYGCKNGFETIPKNPSKDSRGIIMQMVYPKL